MKKIEKKCAPGRLQVLQWSIALGPGLGMWVLAGSQGQPNRLTAHFTSEKREWQQGGTQGGGNFPHMPTSGSMELGSGVPAEFEPIH